MEEKELLSEFELSWCAYYDDDDLEGMRIGEYVLRRDPKHPLYGDKTLYGGTLFYADSDEEDEDEQAAYDFERGSEDETWNIYPAYEDSRWERCFDRAAFHAARKNDYEDYERAAAHPHLPAWWARLLLDFCEDDMRACHSRDGWVKVLSRLISHADPQISMNAKQLLDKWS